MKLSKHFTLLEFTKSQTALRRGIRNEPAPREIQRLRQLCEVVLEPVRARFGVTVVNSGYRSAELNRAIGGAETSQHCHGFAADVECPGTSNLDLARWIRDMLDFDQLILECYDGKDPSSGWVHVSYVIHGVNRGSVLTYTVRDGRGEYSAGLPS